MSKVVFTGSVSVDNRTQLVHLPAETRFPGNVKRLSVRVSGQDRFVSPIDKSWDSFFFGESRVSSDFISERTSQFKKKRESFD